MRIGIDISNLHNLSKKRGIGFYIKYLIDSLKTYTKVEVFVLENKNDQRHLDLIHYPYFDLYRPTLPLYKKLPTVLTVHDVTPLLFPAHYPPGLKGKLNYLRQRLSLLNVKAIITDSHSSKKDIEKKLRVSPSKIYPIHLAPSEHFKKIDDKNKLDNLRKKFKLPDKFVIYAGSVNWNKNLNNLAESCIRAEVDLVLAGSDFNNRQDLGHIELKSFKNFLEKYSMNKKIHILGFVSTDELAGLINLADILMLVSFYEGFGLTILEAQACGTPVITSQVSSMPEIAGEGAILVEPGSVESIVKAIKNLKDSRLRTELVRKGFENVGKFNWKKTAKETEAVYEKVLR